MKHKAATLDYQKAKEIADSLGVYSGSEIAVDNKKAFRRYLTDLGKFNNRKFKTVANGNNLTVLRIV